jgi:hypothetical protein
MHFSLDVRRARKGDCLLLHFGSKDDPGLIMIDGGPKSVYRPQLRPRLEEIRKARGLTDRQPLPVDLLMVSHVDDDHIQGILDLTREEIVAQDERRPQLLNVQGLWHNSFDEIIGHTPDELTASVRRQFGAASVTGGELPDDAKLEVEESYEREHPDEDDLEPLTGTLKVLASIEQGFSLRLAAAKLGYPRNPGFDGKLIIARQGDQPVALAGRLKLFVIGPMQTEIAALHKKHQEWLKELQKAGRSPAEVLAAYVDKSVPNLSSIVVLAELAGKKMLLTGDARGDKILEGLETVGLVGKGDKIAVDLLKVPHHGSSNNLDHDFFERIVATHYVFSGNGEHGNPERETLAMLFDARHREPFTIHLTYPIEEIDRGRQADWEKEQTKEKNKRDSKKTAVEKEKARVRPDWSPPTHSLAAFFAERKLARARRSRSSPTTRST